MTMRRDVHLGEVATMATGHEARAALLHKYVLLCLPEALKKRR